MTKFGFFWRESYVHDPFPGFAWTSCPCDGRKFWDFMSDLLHEAYHFGAYGGLGERRSDRSGDPGVEAVIQSWVNYQLFVIWEFAVTSGLVCPCGCKQTLTGTLPGLVDAWRDGARYVFFHKLDARGVGLGPEPDGSIWQPPPEPVPDPEYSKRGK